MREIEVKVRDGDGQPSQRPGSFWYEMLSDKHSDIRFWLLVVHGDINSGVTNDPRAFVTMQPGTLPDAGGGLTWLRTDAAVEVVVDLATGVVVWLPVWRETTKGPEPMHLECRGGAAQAALDAESFGCRVELRMPKAFSDGVRSKAWRVTDAAAEVV